MIYVPISISMIAQIEINNNYYYTSTLTVVLCSQEKFTQEMQPHYIYSPREMTRWVRGICEALRPLETLSVEGLVRIWAHEALRLFQDRYVGRVSGWVSGWVGGWVGV